jgi:gliding motility-associated lipoprotein GldH
MSHPFTNHPESTVHPLPGRATLLIFFLAGISFLTSCDRSRVYEKNIRIPDGIWYSDNHVQFEVTVEDTISPHNLYINVRSTNLYPFSNLYLFITTTAPSGDFVEDTVNVILTDEKGKRKGSGLGDIWDLQQSYKKNVRFAQRGIYSFDYQQAMRTDKLPFILDVGLRVEKAD